MTEPNFITKLSTFGNLPVAKFGHTATLVSKDQVIIFGGASGNADTFSITNEAYCLSIEENSLSWTKLNNTGTIPCPRAAHASCKIDDSKLVLFGGATGSGGFAPDILYLLHLDGDKAVWSEVAVVGEKPAKRYGHTQTFTNPYAVLFGGNIGTKNTNGGRMELD